MDMKATTCTGRRELAGECQFMCDQLYRAILCAINSFMPQFSSVAETSEIRAVEITLGDNNRKDRYKILGIYRPPAASLPAFSTFVLINITFL